MKKLTIFCALVVCAFAIIAVSCGGGSSKSPSGLSEKMNDYMVAGDYEKAVTFWFDNADMTQEGGLKPKNAEEMQQLVALFGGKLKEEVEKHGGIEKVSVIKEEVSEDGNSAEVTVETIYKDGKTNTDEHSFVKVDGNWKFSNDSNK